MCTQPRFSRSASNFSEVMPLSQRNVYSSDTYGHAELYSDSSKSSEILAETRVSSTLGALHQIGFLSSYCNEIFDGLVTLSDDMSTRIASASQRVEKLAKNVEKIEAQAEAGHLNASSSSE